MKPFVLYLIRFIMVIVPESRGFKFKRMLYRYAGAQIGKNVRICSSANIHGFGNLTIGDDTWIGSQCYLYSSSDIKIGSNVDVAPRVYIGTGTHQIDLVGKNVAGLEISKDVVIGDGCWLGVGAIILPGVEVGNKCVIGAGTVVTKSFSNYLLLAGVPAEIKRILVADISNEI